ncbi:hypothetical protein GCM10020000_55100 [Streptomyces olivoverticillatus]
MPHRSCTHIGSRSRTAAARRLTRPRATPTDPQAAPPTDPSGTRARSRSRVSKSAAAVTVRSQPVT